MRGNGSMLLFILMISPVLAAQETAREPRPKAALTDEEKEILKNREILENLDLLRDFEKFRFFDYFAAEGTEDKAKEQGKPAAKKEVKKAAKKEEKKNEIP